MRAVKNACEHAMKEGVMRQKVKTVLMKRQWHLTACIMTVLLGLMLPELSFAQHDAESSNVTQKMFPMMIRRVEPAAGDAPSARNEDEQTPPARRRYSQPSIRSLSQKASVEKSVVVKPFDSAGIAHRRKAAWLRMSENKTIQVLPLSPQASIPARVHAVPTTTKAAHMPAQTRSKQVIPFPAQAESAMPIPAKAERAAIRTFDAASTHENYHEDANRNERPLVPIQRDAYRAEKIEPQIPIEAQQ